ncbi:MAG TPA: heparinase II/III family protein, partial [Opitutaceae bacterium]|nr:heparinase II/III family protein [Opitutaceae bacterium]
LPAAEPAPAPGAVRRRGLLFDAADLPRIRANLRDPRFSNLWREMSTMDQATTVDVAAETAFLEKEMRFTNHGSHMVRARAALERAAFQYVTTGDAAQLGLARLALRKVCEFPKWDYFLEGGRDVIGLQRAPEATIAVACALDWLGDALTPAEVALAEQGLAEKGAPACYRTLYGMKYPDRVRGWTLDPEDEFPFKFDLGRWPLILNSTNLKTVPIAGLGLAACWLHGRHPLAAQWLALARSSARAFVEMFHPDGSYDEGPMYWSYTASHLAFFAEVLYRTLGVDDRSLFNYPGTMRYALVMSMPTAGAPIVPPESQRKPSVPYAVLEPANDIVNFGDAGVNLDTSLAPWVARVHRDPLSQHLARQVGVIKSHWGAIWYDPALPEAAPGPELLDVRLDNDWVISRTGWTAADGVLAFRSGGPGNHEHADRNSLIFKVHGERLLHDPLRAGYSPKIERWKLRQTSAHNAVLVDGKGHQYHDGHEGTNASWAWAHILEYRTGPDWMTLTSDATEAYALVQPDVARVRRIALYLKPGVLVLLDHVVLTGEPKPVQVRYQVFNDDGHGRVASQASGFEITRPLASLTTMVRAAGGLAVRTGQLDLPAEEGVYPFAEAESAAAKEHTVLTVSAARAQGGRAAELTVARAGAGWRVTGTQEGRPIEVVVTPEGVEMKAPA